MVAQHKRCKHDGCVWYGRHIVDCTTCSGWGLWKAGGWVTAAEAITLCVKDDTNNTLKCPECGSTYRGVA